MNLLIVGGAGYIGSHIVLYALEEDTESLFLMICQLAEKKCK